MIKLNSYVPTHQQIARLEHAIVVNRRLYYTLHESKQMDREQQVKLELDYLNLCYWKHHSHSQESPRVGEHIKLTNGVTRATRMPTTETNIVSHPDCIPRLEDK